MYIYTICIFTDIYTLVFLYIYVYNNIIIYIYIFRKQLKENTHADWLIIMLLYLDRKTENVFYFLFG